MGCIHCLILVPWLSAACHLVDVNWRRARLALGLGYTTTPEVHPYLVKVQGAVLTTRSLGLSAILYLRLLLAQLADPWLFLETDMILCH